MKKFFLLFLLIGCGTGSDSEKVQAVPGNSYLQCGDLDVSVQEAADIAAAAAEQQVPVTYEMWSTDAPEVAKSNGVVVVACGGTFVNDESQDNDTTTTSVENVKKNLSSGAISEIYFK